MNKVLTKIALIQAELKPIIKDDNNPHFKSKYFDINTVISVLKPILSKHGVTVMQPLTMVDGRMAIKTVIYADGEIFAETVALPECSDAQKYGSAITYFRRYSLVSLFLIEGEEDDDANSVSNKVSAPMNTNKPISCDKCAIGMMVKKNSAKGEFIACDQYPTCKNILKN